MNADRIALIIVSAIVVLFAFHNYHGANAQTPQTTLRPVLSSSFVGVQATINGSPGAGIWLIGSDYTLRFCHIVGFDQAPTCSPPVQPR